MEQNKEGYLPLHLAIEITSEYDIMFEVINKTENLNVLNQ